MATIDDILAATKIIDEAESNTKPDEVRPVVVESADKRVGGTSVVNNGSNGELNDALSGDVGVKENGNGYLVDNEVENVEGSSEEIEDKQELGVEKVEDENRGFQVGDVVWGKIKSHPWWPGQIYDTKDASEFALGFIKEGRQLVAFFGDESCSWCLPPQMVPFVEKFGGLAKASRSEKFLEGMKDAAAVIGRVVELGMVCRCVPEENRGGLAWPVVKNAGVKDGVRTPGMKRGRISVPDFEPVDMLSKLRYLGKVASVENVLELAVLRGRVSAYYRFKSGLELPAYRDPVTIEGLEDPDKNVTAPVANDFSVPIEVPIHGPTDDWLSSPSKATSDGKNTSKRKLKSMAEIIGESTNVKRKVRNRATVKEGTGLLSETSLLKGKKSEDSSSHKTSSKRMIDVLGAPENNQNVLSAQTSNHGGVNGGDEGAVSEKPKETEVPSAENTHGEEKEGFEPLTSPRERRKSWYLSDIFSKTGKETESNKIPKKARLTEHITNASEENHADRKHLERFDASANKSPETAENDKKLSFSISDVGVPVNEFLSKIHRFAADPLHLTKDGSSDEVFAFASALRSSTYVQGRDYKTLRRYKGIRKRKLSALLLETVENNQKSSKAVKKEDKPKKKAKASKSNVVKPEEKASQCLILTFVPGFVLPSKKDIVKHFRKFGSLNEQETNVMPDCNSVQVVFVKESDVKKALKSSLHKNSFGFQNIYETRLPSSHGSSSKAALPHIPTHEGEDTSDDLASNVRIITAKLETMTATLSKYQTKFSEEDKSVLKKEMKSLIKNVNRVSKRVEIASGSD